MKYCVWISNLPDPAGDLTVSKGGKISFKYREGHPETEPISRRLRVANRCFSGEICEAVFSGLQANDLENRRLAGRYRLKDGDPIAPIALAGGDLFGALSILTPGRRPADIGRFPEDYREVHKEELEWIVKSMATAGHLPGASAAFAGLPGRRAKFTCVYHEKKVWIPKNGRPVPTSHILKIPSTYAPEQLLDEYHLLRAAGACGIDRVDATPLSVQGPYGPLTALLLKRFDRSFDGESIKRIQAESFAVLAGRRHEKRWLQPSEAGVSYAKLAECFDFSKWIRKSLADQEIFNLLVGHSENHLGKRCLLYAGEETILSPLYGVTPVFDQPDRSTMFGAAINGRAYAEDLAAGDLEEYVFSIAKLTPFDLSGRVVRFGGNILRMLLEIGADELLEKIVSQMSVLSETTGIDFPFPLETQYIRRYRDEPEIPF